MLRKLHNIAVPERAPRGVFKKRRQSRSPVRCFPTALNSSLLRPFLSRWPRFHIALRHFRFEASTSIDGCGSLITSSPAFQRLGANTLFLLGFFFGTMDSCFPTALSSSFPSHSQALRSKIYFHFSASLIYFHFSASFSSSLVFIQPHFQISLVFVCQQPLLSEVRATFRSAVFLSPVL